MYESSPEVCVSRNDQNIEAVAVLILVSERMGITGAYPLGTRGAGTDRWQAAGFLVQALSISLDGDCVSSRLDHRAVSKIRR
jgi:hypothetical protein